MSGRICCPCGQNSPSTATSTSLAVIRRVFFSPLPLSLLASAMFQNSVRLSGRDSEVYVDSRTSTGVARFAGILRGWFAGHESSIKIVHLECGELYRGSAL